MQHRGLIDVHDVHNNFLIEGYVFRNGGKVARRVLTKTLARVALESNFLQYTKVFSFDLFSSLLQQVIEFFGLCVAESLMKGGQLFFGEQDLSNFPLGEQDFPFREIIIPVLS